MDTSNGGSKNSAGFDPLDVDPLGAIDDNVVLSSNGNGVTVVDVKPNFIDDFESQIDSLIVNTPPAVKAESPTPEISPVKTKGKRTYKKKRSKVTADSEDSTEDEESEFESKRFKKETSSNNSINSNEDSDAALSSARSRRSSRKSRPNNFYTKNYELESGSGSDNDKKSKGKKNFDEEEYTPVKEKKIKTPKSNAGRKKKNLEESMADETSATTTSETMLNFSNETPFAVDPAVLIPNATDVSANDLDVSTSGNNVTPVILDVTFADPDVSITAEVTDNTPAVADKPLTPKANSTKFSTLKKSGVSVRPVEVGTNLTEIKIASVSSMADKTPNSSKNNPISNIFKETQTHKACNFIKDALTTTAELGNLLNSKANEFVEKKATDSFMTDTRKLQFCMEKAFVLFNLARNNLSGIEKKLKSEYADFMIKNRYDRLLKCDKNTNAFLRKYDMTLDPLEVKSSPGAVDSDSDCEIVEVASAPGPARPLPAGRPRPGQKQRPAELDILRRVERNGISWKAKKSAGGGSVSSDGEGVQKVQLPGKNPVWINKNICVKKVTPAKNSNRSFFREDGRTLKPPDPPGTPFSKSVKPTDLSAARPVGKTALVLCWLDLAHRQTDNNFFSTLKEMEKPKRKDSCSDLGESCSDDEDVPAVVSEKFLSAFSEDFLTVCRNVSLLKLCIDRMNSIFLARAQNLLDKFNFHLFDDFPEPNDYSEDDEEVIRPIISTSKDIVNTNTPNKLSKDGISDDPLTVSLPVTSKETPAANQLETPTDPQILTGNQLGPTNTSGIDAMMQLQTVDTVADVSGHLRPFEESIITNVLHLPPTPEQKEHKIVDAFNQLSEQDITIASKNIDNIEETFTDHAFINLPTTDQAVTEVFIDLPTAVEQAISDSSVNLPTMEQVITDVSFILPTSEQAITDTPFDLPTGEKAITDTPFNLPTAEKAIPEASINLPTAEPVITDSSINLPTAEQAIADAATALDASINLPTMEQVIIATTLDFPTAEQAIADASINLPTAEHAIIDNLIDFSTLEQKCTDSSVDLLSTKPVIITNVLSPISSIDPEKGAISITKSTADITKTPAKSVDAFKYLLASSSNSDSSSSSVRIQKKKKYRKRVKKISRRCSEENGSISEICKVTDSSDSGETDEGFSKFKDDPKFYYKTTVDVVPLSARQLQPFQKILEELAKDLEIEK